MQLSTLLIYALIVVYVLYRQMRPKEIKSSNKKIYAILLIGIYILFQSVNNHAFIINMANIIGLLISLILVALGLGIFRGYTCHVWSTNGQMYRQATWLTMLLWALMIIIHGTITHFLPQQHATMILYIGITLLAQQAVLQYKANQI